MESNLIYISSLMGEKEREILFSKYNFATGEQAQKYHRLLVSGLSHHLKSEIVSISILPINRKITKKLFFFNEEEEKVNEKIKFKYVNFINFPIVRQLSIFFSVYKNLAILYKEKGSYSIVCDVLNFSSLFSSLIFRLTHRVKIIGIVTDIPTYRVSSFRTKGVRKLLNNIFNTTNNFLASRSDAFVLVTENMNSIINKKHKPSIVIECLERINYEKTPIKDNVKFIVLYSGGLLIEYGVINLLEAFVLANISNSELHIYGDGPCRDIVKKFSDKYENIIYFGYVKNETVVYAQKQASILVNPRITTAEYTKYSFPIKNIEYMSSGTPTLTTKLLGIPNEYYDFVHTLENDSIRCICDSLIKLSQVDSKTHHEFGLKAKLFINRSKNNIVQSKKVIDLVSLINPDGNQE